MRRYVEAAASDGAFQAYLEETTLAVPSHEAYVERFVPRAWRDSHPVARGGRAGKGGAAVPAGRPGGAGREEGAWGRA